MDEQCFRDAVVERLGCKTEDYETAVLWHCLYSDSTFIPRQLWRLNPSYFDPDLDLIRQLGNVRRFRDFEHIVNHYRKENSPQGFFRGALNIRVSGKKLIKLAARVFKHRRHPSSGRPNPAPGTPAN